MSDRTDSRSVLHRATKRPQPPPCQRRLQLHRRRFRRPRRAAWGHPRRCGRQRRL